MTRMLAGMGGFLRRKGDGEPSVKTIWEGYDKLLHYIEAAMRLDYKNMYKTKAWRYEVCKSGEINFL